jgi:hypothetical protein
MTAEPVHTDWYLGLPEEYRDRVRFDPTTGLPTYMDVTAGAYDHPAELTNADRHRCGLPPLIIRDGPRKSWDPPNPYQTR